MNRVHPRYHGVVNAMEMPRCSLADPCMHHISLIPFQSPSAWHFLETTLISPRRSLSQVLMAFRFGFANDNDSLNADDGDGVCPTPNAMEPNVPPVREHGLKELVGNIFPLLSH